MTADLYQCPSREAIAREAGGQDEKAAAEPDYAARLGQHLTARLRALGRDQAWLKEEAGISGHIAARALNGNGADLMGAARLAAAVGSSLPAMLVPYKCRTCQGTPPAGYRCLECREEGARK